MKEEAPQAEYETFQFTFKYFRNPRKLNESQLLESCLIVLLTKKRPELTRQEALRETLNDLLIQLSSINRDFAKLLEKRFWNGETIEQIIADALPGSYWNVSPRTIRDRTRKAIVSFAELFIHAEKNCQQKLRNKSSYDYSSQLFIDISQANKNPPIISFPSNKDALDSQNTKGRAKVWWIVSFVIICAVFSYPLFLARTFLPLASQSTVTHTSDNKEITSYCGEKQTHSVWNPHFVPQQGVSLFTLENTPNGILNNNIRTLALAPEGILIGYYPQKESEEGGVTYLIKNASTWAWATCDNEDTNSRNEINSILVDQNENIWVALDNFGLMMFDGTIWSSFIPNNSNLPSEDTYELTLGNDNSIWVGTWAGVSKYDGEKWEVIYSNEEIDLGGDNSIHNVAFDNEGNIWLGHISTGISFFDGKNGIWMQFRKNDGSNTIGGNKIRDIEIFSAKGLIESETIWIATADGGVSKFENGIWENYTLEDGLPSLNVEDIAFDTYGRVWLATDKGTVFNNGSNWETYTTLNTSHIIFEPGCSDNNSCRDDHVWTGTFGNGLTHSRLPYPDKTITVTEICFNSPNRETICPPLIETNNPNVITATYPITLSRGETLDFEISISPAGNYALLESRGDFLSYVGDETNLAGAYPIIPVTGSINPGQPFIFSNYNNVFTPILLPEEEMKTFISPWRIWMHTRYTQPEIRIVFTMK